MMIATGVLTLLVSTIQHRSSLRMLRAAYDDVVSVFSLPSLVSGLFGALGFIALAVVILRM